MRLFFLSLILFSTTAMAAVDPSVVSRAEKYLNTVQNLQGSFTQRSSSGASDEGVFYLSRPGKMRLEYASPMTIVSDGKRLIYHDKSLDQITHLALDSIPAGILFRSNIHLTGKDIKVLKTEFKDGFTEVTVGMAEDPGVGSLKMYFTSKDFELRGWQVKDASGLVTRVTLNNIREVGVLKKSLFKINRHKTQSVEGTAKPSNGFY
ncbi:MAG: outer membrane lipoprotein carrier protein LolA [Alphaproteobacteria bacterium]|nr:outer membrane lipoprotein carrier protein LolA [Alphaproteobacteria bacterium]